MKWAEKIGLIKFDFLGLKTLTHIQNALNLVKENRGRALAAREIPIHDKGIYELIEINEKLRNLIHEQAGEQQLLAEARKHSASMSDDGRQCVLDGITSMEEVLRVTTQL